MRSIRFALPFFLWAALHVFACKNEPKQTNSLAAPTGEPELTLYAVNVDKLNLRDQPSKNGKTVLQFPEGYLVEGLGEISENKEEAVLRDLNYLEPYIKVATRSTPPDTGWAFGGGLTLVFTGKRSDSPNGEKMTQLADFLKSLDATQLESGKKAWEFVATNLNTASGSLADATFILLEQFLSRMEHSGSFYKLTEAIQWTSKDFEEIENRRFDVGKNPTTKSLSESGFALAQGEGMVFPVVDWNRLQTFFGAKVTPTMKKFMDQRVLENNKQAWEDGGIILPLEAIADRAAFWEKFNRENPHFVLGAETSESERWMRLVLVCGADNTPTYDYETREIGGDYKKVWTYIQQQYPGTKLAASATLIEGLCKAEGWKRTRKVEDWQTEFAQKE
jgi:hypothetical protein